VEGFTEKYNIHRLVFFEEINAVESEIILEKQNFEWKDLHEGII